MKDLRDKIAAPLAMVFLLAMFVYSGVNKVARFDKKVNTLKNKISCSLPVARIGMAGVIFLEIVLSIYLAAYFFAAPHLLSSPRVPLRVTKALTWTALASVALFLAFLVVVTFIYHPPQRKRMIPFLSNVTVFGGFLLALSMVIGHIKSERRRVLA